ncbi:MAG: TetR family transcriptional regulator [Ilumatobacteraceae bacterium]
MFTPPKRTAPVTIGACRDRRAASNLDPWTRPAAAPAGHGSTAARSSANPSRRSSPPPASSIGQFGVEQTTMSRLAAHVGLKQSSLYYYFPNREAVIAALVARANVIPLALIGGIVADGGSAPACLYRFVRGDVEALCALPFDINEIHRVAMRDRERFAAYWSERSVLERRLASVVRRGCRDGELREVDPHLTALTIMANDEGVQNWYRLGSKRRPPAIGEALATTVVGGLLAEGHSMSEVLAEVSTYY